MTDAGETAARGGRVYVDMVAAGRLALVRRKEGISTTDGIRRVLAAARTEPPA